MAAAAGIAAFFVSLFVSYQLFPDPGTGSMGYVGGRFVFTLVATIIVSVVASRASKRRIEAKAELESEQERKRANAEKKEERKRAQDQADHEDNRRVEALRDARARVDQLRNALGRREQQRRDSDHRSGRFEFGVVADTLLAELVCRELQVPFDERTSITAAQMEKLTGDLHVHTYRNQKDYLDLEGLQYATELSGLVLNLGGNRANLEPLAGLVGLRRLEIYGGTGVADIDALATLDSVRDLVLTGLTDVTDFRPLAGLERLTRARFAGLSAELEFDSISGLVGLAKLEVGPMSHLHDLSGMSSLSQITEVVLFSIGEISDLAPLALLPRLRKLRLESVHLNSGEQLGRFTGLVSLALREVSGVDNLEAVGALHDLEELEVAGVRMDPYKYEFGHLDLGPLAGLSSLTKLNLTQNGYTNFQNWPALARLVGLVELEIDADLDGSEAFDAVSKLSRLRTLRVSCFRSDLNLISALPRLEKLELKGKLLDGYPSRVEDVKCLASLPMLTSLTLDTLEGSEVLRDVGRLTSLTHLELNNLYLSREYESLESLSRLTNLQSLALRENVYLIRDLHPLAALPYLSTLTVRAKSYEDPWDITPLMGIAGLSITK